MSVPWVRVGDLLRLERRSVEIAPGGLYREIGVRSFGRGIFHKEPVSGAELGTKKVFKVEPGDLVVSNVFAWEGAVGCATDRERGRIGSHRFMTWVPKCEDVDVRYVAHFLLSDSGMSQLRRASPGSAGRNRTLAIGGFRELRIPLPGLDDQRRIAARLDAVARFREAVEAKAAARVRALAIAPRLTDEVLSRERLDPVPVRELFDVVSDVVHPGEDPAPAERFVGLEYIEPHTGRRLGQTSLGDLRGRKLRFSFGDVLYGYLRPYQNKVWRADGPGLCSVEQYVLRPRAGVDGRLLGHVLRAQSTLDRVNDATHRLQLPRIRTALLGAIEVPDIRRASADLGDRLERITDLVARLSSAQTRQTQALASLLPAARNEEFSRLTSA